MAQVRQVTLTGFGLHLIFRAAVTRMDTRDAREQWVERDYECADEILTAVRALPQRTRVAAELAAIEDAVRNGTLDPEGQAFFERISALEDESVPIRLLPGALEWVVARLPLVQSPPTLAGPRVRTARALRDATLVEV